MDIAILIKIIALGRIYKRKPTTYHVVPNPI